MDALDLLEQQHTRLVDDFSAVDVAATPGKRTAAVVQLVRTIEAHSRVEETVFYGAFVERIGSAEPRLYEAFESHALLRFAALKLLRTRATDVRFGARLRMVRELFERHVHIEEDWMFPKAKRALLDEILDEIGTDLERAHAARLSLGVSILERPRARRWVERPAMVERRALV
jgi:hypothetical protein